MFGAGWYEARQRRLLVDALDATLSSIPGVTLCGPLAVTLYRSCSPRYRHIHGLQCWFALRYSELSGLSLERIRHGAHVPIATSKGGNPRTQSAAIARGVPEWQLVTIDAVPGLDEYESVSRDVSRAVGRLGIPLHREIQCHTHIWRHLRAYHMIAQGRQIDDIALVLGHRSLDSTRAYIGSVG